MRIGLTKRDDIMATIEMLKLESQVSDYLRDVQEPLRKAYKAQSIWEFNRGMDAAIEMTNRFEAIVRARADVSEDWKCEFASGFLVFHFEGLKSVAKQDLEAAKLQVEFVAKAIENEYVEKGNKPESEDWANEGRENAKFWIARATGVAADLAKKNTAGEFTRYDLEGEIELKLELTERHSWQAAEEMIERKIIIEVRFGVYKIAAKT